MDFRHLIVTCLFSMLRLSFETQKIKENYAIFIDKSPLFFCQRQADNSVNTPMLPSLTPGCTDSLHPGVKDGNMGVSGN